MSFFDELIEEIKTEYANNANDISWRFLSGSKETLVSNNSILLISFNPGGDFDLPDHPKESCENGHAYLVETWKSNQKPGCSPLQKQFQLLFKEIANILNVENYEELLNHSVTACFVPFRSPGERS